MEILYSQENINGLPTQIKFVTATQPDYQNLNSRQPDIVDVRERGLNPMKLLHLVACKSVHKNALLDLQTKADIVLSTLSENPETVLVTFQSVVREDEIQDRINNALEQIQNKYEDIDLKEYEQSVEKFSLVREKLKKYLSDSSSESEVVACCDTEKRALYLIGLHGAIQEVDDNIMVHMEAESVVDELFTRNQDEMAVLKLADSENEVRTINKELQFRYEETGVAVKGLSEDVQTIALKMRRTLQKYSLISVPFAGKKLEFVGRPEVRDYISREYEAYPKTKNCRWRLDQETIQIIVEPKHEAECRSITEKCICEEFIELNDHEKNKVFKGKNWIAKRSMMDSEFKQCFMLNLSETERMSKLHLICTRDLYLNIMEQIQDFRKKNALMEKSIKCPPRHVKFVELLKESRNVPMFETEYIELTRQKEGFSIRATKVGIKGIEYKLRQTKRHIYGILSNACLTYLGSETGKVEMCNTGKEHGCHILLKENVDIVIVKGSIQEQEADVLVNSVSEDLYLNVGQPKVATSMLEKGGPEFQAVLKRNYPKGIKEWQIAYCVGAGGLRCKEVFNCCLAQSTSCGKFNEQEYTKIIKTCLFEANKRKHKSIMIPALGTGNFKYLPEKAAKILFTTIADFIREIGCSSLKKISIVLLPENTPVLQAFENAFNTYCPKVPSSGDPNLFIRNGQTTGGTCKIYRWELDIISDLDDVSDAVAELEHKYRQYSNEQTQPKQL